MTTEEEEKKTILVVDDDAMIRMVLANMLKKEGYEVELAAEGGEALKKFKEVAPVLVLSDRLMPEGMSGFDLLKQLREIPSDVPFVFLTSLTDPRDKMVVSEYDVSCYLDKPVTAEVLRECLRKLLA